MRNLRAYISEHKKMFGIVGLVFIVCMECCTFPVGKITFGGNMTIGVVNVVCAIFIAKCIGEIEVAIFPQVSYGLIFLLNIGITIMGMVARYFLEYGEVSNTYNFTPKNIVIHTIIMLLLSTMFWVETKGKGEATDEKK